MTTATADTEQSLIAELAEFCDANDLPDKSADELLLLNLYELDTDKRHARTLWLADFIGRWEAVMETPRNIIDDESYRASLIRHRVNFEGVTLHLRDKPEVPALVDRLNEAAADIKRLFFRMRPDVLGEDNHAAIEYERGYARAILNLLRPFAV